RFAKKTRMLQHIEKKQVARREKTRSRRNLLCGRTFLAKIFLRFFKKIYKKKWIILHLPTFLATL
ncbi:MAG: hypothetical protein II596_01205, partial [Thermoguttaceae bacterium]|nr:hypothetical protein [Thermoguttaceae bacterium]